MVKTVSNQMNDLHEVIYANRCSIAELKKLKITARSEAWEDASGIADEKKDHVRSQVAQLDEKIALAEAEIEKAYNTLKVLELELEHSDE